MGHSQDSATCSKELDLMRAAISHFDDVPACDGI